MTDTKAIPNTNTEAKQAFDKGAHNTIARAPKRGHYDKATVYDVLDAALVCHVGFIDAGQPFVIPSIHVRIDDTLLLHGATTSRLLKHVEVGHPLCITVTLLDALVLARSVFHHSMNYRSAVVFGSGRILAHEQKLDALERFTEKLIPGRWEDARQPNAKEFKATTVVAVDIETASAKVRSGPPADDKADYALDVWAGLLPLKQGFELPQADPQLKSDIRVPDYVRRYSEG